MRHSKNSLTDHPERVKAATVTWWLPQARAQDVDLIMQALLADLAYTDERPAVPNRGQPSDGTRRRS